MRLTSRLLYYVNRRRIPGKIDIGKHRRREIISSQMKYWAAQDMIREYDNIQLLSRPYLTAEQEKKWEEIQDEKVAAQELEDMYTRQRENMPKHITFQDALAQLNVTKKWG